jgi:FtsH-binding integral membrane protein
METNKPLVRAGYLLAALLVMTPLVDGTMQLLPLRLGDERWRFGAVGSLSNLLLVPLFGLFLAIVIAAFTDSRRTQRVIGAICGALALLLTILSLLFILDYFQVRTVVAPKLQHATAVASTAAMIKNVLSIIALALLSRAGFAGPRAVTPVRRVPSVRGPSSTPLIPLSGAARAE